MAAVGAKSERGNFGRMQFPLDKSPWYGYIGLGKTRKIQPVISLDQPHDI